MKTILVGECATGQVFEMSDPDAPSESEFEYSVARALTCVYRGYRCIVFGGTFQLDDRCYRPDLALIASDNSHWFVIEVELVTHSFNQHVLPQVRALRYGEPQEDCVNILSRELNIDVGEARTLVRLVPRQVAVVANKYNPEWEQKLSVLDVQLLSVSAFNSRSGMAALEVEGVLEVFEESVGFGRYSATDRSLVFPRSVRLPGGQINLCDSSGSASLWTVSFSDKLAWVKKDVGVPDIPDSSFVRIVKAFDGRLSLRRSS
jgi:hypothetical protein